MQLCPTLPLPTNKFTLGGGFVGSDGALVSGGQAPGSAYSFPPSPVHATPCGFCVVLPKFSLKFLLPTFNFPPKIPLPFVGIGLSCDLSHPVDVSAGVGFGGGRVPNPPPDPDREDDLRAAGRIAA